MKKIINSSPKYALMEEIISEEIEKIIQSTNEDEDMLFEMANIYPEDTGLNCIVWVQSATPNNHGKHNTPRIKVEYKNNQIPISIDDNPQILANGGNVQIDSKTFKAIVKWIKINKDLLLTYYNTPMSTKVFLNSVKSI